MKIYRDNLTVVIDKEERGYGGENFIIYVKYKNLSEFEKDLLRWAFGVKHDMHFQKTVIYYPNKPYLRFEENISNKKIQKIEVNGELLKVYWDYISRRNVLPGELELFVEELHSGGYRISRPFYPVIIDFKTGEHIPDFFMDFLRTRREADLKKYIPYGDGLTVNISNDRVTFRTNRNYSNHSVLDIVKTESGYVLRGPTVFKNGFAEIEVPVERFPKIKKNLLLGPMPQKYVRTVYITYPDLKIDEVRISLNISNGTPAVEIISAYRRTKIRFTTSRATLYKDRKRREASIQTLPKYLRLAGFCE